MAYENGLLTTSVPASTDLSAKQYFGVKIDTNGQLALAGEGDAAVGVLQDKPAAQGRVGCIAIGGVSKVACGGTIAKGERFSFDSAGKAVSVGSGNDWSMGVMLEAGAAGIISTCIIQPTGPTV